MQNSRFVLNGIAKFDMYILIYGVEKGIKEKMDRK